MNTKKRAKHPKEKRSWLKSAWKKRKSLMMPWKNNLKKNLAKSKSWMT